MSIVRLWGVTVRRGGEAAPHPVLDNLNLVIDAGELVVGHRPARRRQDHAAGGRRGHAAAPPG